MSGGPKRTMQERFDIKCRTAESGCIEWTATLTKNGYGIFYSDASRGISTTAHRHAYQQAHGPVAKGLDVCHRCDNRKCVNVEHLFLGTRKENMQDAKAKGRLSHKPRVQGVKHWASKITDEHVRVIRQMRLTGASIGQIAAALSVSYMIVYRIVHGFTWTHVTENKT